MLSYDVQLAVFLLDVLVGMAFGLLFDLHRLARGLVRPRGWWADLGDVVFWLVAGPVLLLGVWAVNWGELRIFLFLGLACGFALYLWLASPAVLAAGAHAIRGGRKVARLGRRIGRGGLARGRRAAAATWRGGQRVAGALRRRGAAAGQGLRAWLARFWRMGR